jgi:hypothetical protein
MALDTVEKRILYFVPLSFFFIFLFFPLNLGMKILFSSAILFFLVLFSLCAYWTQEWYPERKLLVGFLVSLLHTFLYIFGGFLGFFFSFLVSKFFPFLINYFKEIFSF